MKHFPFHFLTNMFLKNFFIHSPSSLIFKRFLGLEAKIITCLAHRNRNDSGAKRSVLFCFPFPSVTHFGFDDFRRAKSNMCGEIKFPIYNSNVVVVENISSFHPEYL